MVENATKMLTNNIIVDVYDSKVFCVGGIDKIQTIS